MRKKPSPGLVRIAAAIVLTAAGGAIAQEPPGLRPGVDFAAIDAAPARASAAFTAFTRDNGGTWWTRWCPATGTPMEVFGTGLPIAGWHDTMDDARRQANAVLLAYGDLLGTGADEFRESIGTTFGNLYTFTFQQYHHGLPVIGGRADVRIHRVGRVAFFGSQAFPVAADQPVVPVLDELRAEAIAWAALGKVRGHQLAAAPQPTRLVLWGDIASASPTSVSLCWEVAVDAVDAEGRGPIGRYYVDALTGAVRHYTNDKHECGFAGCTLHRPHVHPQPVHRRSAVAAPVPTTVTVMAWARDGSSMTTPATNVPMSGLEVVVPGVGTMVTDANGQFTVDIPSAVNVSVVMDGIHHTLITGASAVTQTATLQPGVPTTIQLLTAGATSAELAHTTCALWTDRVNAWSRGILGNSPELALADQCHPTVNIGSTCNAYYTNNTINFYAAGGSCNNTASSSVVAHEWGHGLDDRYGGISQVQGLSEGWGDILSEYLLDNPVIGEGFYTASGGGIRDGRNTTQYPPPTEVHAAGEVWMGFAWLFRENLRANLGTPAAIAISEAKVVGSIAADATDQPSAVTQVFLADDNDGNLTNGVPHYSELEAACLAHNLPYPVRQLGTVSAQALADTDLQLQPREVFATATPNLGTFTAVNLVYDDGVAHTVAMVPTGNPGQYHAMLPGYPAPATVRWHIEATHSAGATLRSPGTGDNAYAVFALSRFYFEDFESGAPGWTHNATNGMDDWEIGAPQGLSGPGWSDPTSAYSGAICAGTDLSVDGAYAPSSARSLRAPLLNLTGRAGIRLRFKRWLTIDSITQQDIAMVRCNGSVYWVNVPTGLPPILDGAWVSQELRLNSADNNPATNIDWYLQTGPTGNLGGWNIDDVELFTTSQAVPLPNTLTVNPAMASPGTPMQLTLHTAQPTRPFLIVVGTTQGPTLVPGVPPIDVGGIFINVGGITDASGAYTSNFAAPGGAGATGLVLHYQALALDNAMQVQKTNPTATLFTQ